MREYVVAKADGRLEVNLPSGGVTMWVKKGHRYLKGEAFVVQNPDHFELVEPAETRTRPSGGPLDLVRLE
jgi:hypothetical protein